MNTKGTKTSFWTQREVQLNFLFRRDQQPDLSARPGFVRQRFDGQDLRSRHLLLPERHQLVVHLLEPQQVG